MTPTCASFIAALSGRRSLLAIKLLALFITVGAALSGRPPSKAQAPTLAVTAEDSKQDTEIDYIKLQGAEQNTAVITMQQTLIKQGEDLARLDTKMTFVFSLLGVLQSGGLVLHVRQQFKKQDGSQE